ncbi:hypothetical protein CCR85_00915 [Rhodothalassium salexigens]|uniref:hypothetical protein n=1 Tax=Rhodothalassium salexigens TaxID=1086 RepID=UPI001912BF8F|nr:hypothetical protein [Rhodothalassium salexigens]MBK5910054.1 hypothetical protein [Rhodothalassium salexigens]MBK5921537.1 hypothetical protein [Rhodothalassium salexigens]
MGKSVHWAAMVAGLTVAAAAGLTPASAQSRTTAGGTSVDLSEAMDCGAPPEQPAALPDGERATAEDLRQARQQVSRYSKAVTAWLNCRDRRAKVVFTFMTDEQKERWNEDLDAIHTRRVAVEREMNQAIRTFNERLEREQRGGTG